MWTRLTRHLHEALMDAIQGGKEDLAYYLTQVLVRLRQREEEKS